MTLHFLSVNIFLKGKTIYEYFNKSLIKTCFLLLFSLEKEEKILRASCPRKLFTYFRQYLHISKYEIVSNLDSSDLSVLPFLFYLCMYILYINILFLYKREKGAIAIQFNIYITK